MKLNRDMFLATVWDTIKGDDKDKANDVRTRIIKALDSDGKVSIVLTKDSNVDPTYKYYLYENDAASDRYNYAVADTYSDLFRYGDIKYGFLGMYCDMLEKHNATYTEGLEELGLAK